MLQILRLISAKINKVPFFISEHWPQYHASFPDELLKGQFKVIILNRANVGDVVELLERGNFIFSYKVVSVGFLKGGDWGPYSNKTFDLQYHSKKVKTT